jgi:hypothetical protein
MSDKVSQFKATIGQLAGLYMPGIKGKLVWQTPSKIIRTPSRRMIREKAVGTLSARFRTPGRRDKAATQ